MVEAHGSREPQCSPRWHVGDCAGCPIGGMCDRKPHRAAIWKLEDAGFDSDTRNIIQVSLTALGAPHLTMYFEVLDHLLHSRRRPSQSDDGVIIFETGHIACRQHSIQLRTLGQSLSLQQPCLGTGARGKAVLMSLVGIMMLRINPKLRQLRTQLSDDRGSLASLPHLRKMTLCFWPSLISDGLGKQWSNTL